MELIARDKITELTSLYQGERFPDGRPHVPDDLVERMKKVDPDQLEM